MGTPEKPSGDKKVLGFMCVSWLALKKHLNFYCNSNRYTSCVATNGIDTGDHVVGALTAKIKSVLHKTMYHTM